MRSNGVAERFCTGDASPYEKFEVWAATVPPPPSTTGLTLS